MLLLITVIVDNCIVEVVHFSNQQMLLLITVIVDNCIVEVVHFSNQQMPLTKVISYNTQSRK